MTSDAPVVDPFPVWALLPKKETTAAAYLTKYPNHDGRGVLIAILDSGVDPGAAGLQVTSDGKPKVIGLFDATGSGDVDTSTTVKLDAEKNTITGLTGRVLNLPSSWPKALDGQYHIGVKNGYDLYPKALREKLAKEYVEKNVTPAHKTLQADAMAKMNAFQSRTQSNLNGSGLTSDEKIEREELQAVLDSLTALEKKFVDLGPTYDCVVFNDGNKWNIALDTSESGDLGKATLLGPYSETLKYATLNDHDRLNYGVNVHEDGNLLEIVSMCSAHATHVAAIASANFPQEPEKNGVAPGAQIISICIGDNRLGSMEVGPALMRAMIKVAELKVDVINMSYGEHAHWTGGRVMEALAEVVNKYGVIFCGSAGNHGPALNTIGTPPTSATSAIMSIGAYVSPDMMTAEYSMRAKVAPQHYTWTSRGPTTDGDLGVSVCAPGGAITSVPNWSLKSAQLMNGTSMASPNAAGCVALILSGLKASKIPYSNFSVRRAIENTAAKVPGFDAYAMGHGLLQVEKAFEHLVSHRVAREQDVRFNITVNTDRKGIYLRQVHETSLPSVHAVTVDPVFLNDSERSNTDKIDFEVNLALVCDASWVQIPSHLNLCYSARAFGVRIDPTGLESGLSSTSIRAYDVTNVAKGPLFNISVTVLKPVLLNASSKYQLVRERVALRPGELRREFLAPPSGATSVVIKLKNLSSSDASAFVLHALQLQVGSSCRVQEYEKYFSLAPLAEATHCMSIRGQRSVEVALGKWWSSLGDTLIDYSIEFYGLEPSVASLVFQASSALLRIDVQNNLDKFDELLPVVSLKSAVQPLRPSESKIRPLGPRDLIANGTRQIFENVLTYSFSVPKGGLEVTLSVPLLSDLLYESEYEAQMVMVFDGYKQHVLTSDAYGLTHNYSTKLEKGDYQVRVQVRHESVTLLEKVNDLSLCLVQKLASPVTLDVFATYQQALLEGKKFSAITLAAQATLPVFVGALAADKLPKGVVLSAGGYLTGTVTFVKDELRKKMDTFPFKYIVDSESPKKSKGSSAVECSKGASTPVLPADQLFAEALNELKVTWLGKLSGSKGEELFTELAAKIKGDEAEVASAAEKWVALLLSRIQSHEIDVLTVSVEFVRCLKCCSNVLSD